MLVEIWSDIMCPWCYIGKRRFEAALSEFEHQDEVQIVWKSYQLNPSLKTDTSISISQYLANAKGWSLEYAQEMGEQVSKLASAEGLVYNMSKIVVANTFDAHRLIQLAKDKAKGDEAEERLFRAYFTEGINIADHHQLKMLAEDIGLESTAVAKMLESNDYARAVKMDIYEAQQMQSRSVPFFLIDNKYGASGAQPVKLFLQLLNKAWNDSNNKNPLKNLSFHKN